MKARLYTGIAAVFGALLAAAIFRPVPPVFPAPPRDLRDALADYSAAGQLGADKDASAPAPEPSPVNALRPAAWKNDPRVLLAESYSSDDILALLDATAQGRELLGGFAGGRAAAPAFALYSGLSAREKEFARKAFFTDQENMVAMFVNSPKFRGGRPHVIFYKADWPLFAAACVAAHELQHALDSYAPWHTSIARLRAAGAEKLEKAYASGRFGAADMQLEEALHGLGYADTFFTEYLAYSRGAALLAELSGGDQARRARMLDIMKLKNEGRTVVEDDPLHNPADRQDFLARYFWEGNRSRFKAGIELIFGNEKLLGELRAAGLRTALDELSAYRDAPEPVYQGVHSLR